MNANVSVADDLGTASTREECARQRATHLAVMGARDVLELCVGPSLETLERAYGEKGLRVTGNDIDTRWRRFYPKGRWVMGDAMSVPYDGFDAVVFAPPLSEGCLGTREASLSVDQVRPSYRDFLQRVKGFRGVVTLVLPGRSLSTRHDRKQLFALTSTLPSCEVVPLTSGRRQVTKYVDVYIDTR